MRTSIINPITAAIISVAKDGDTIRQIAVKTGFAYSAVYRWVTVLSKRDVFGLKDGGNKKRLYAKHTVLYGQFAGLIKTIGEVEKDDAFWNFIRKTHLKVRLTGGSSVSLWTRGGYVTGDFFDKIYTLEVGTKNLDGLKKELDRRKISYTDSQKTDARPLIFLISKKNFRVERIGGIPVMPLKELIKWCEKLKLDSVLEQLDALYDLGLKIKYSEMHTNV